MKSKLIACTMVGIALTLSACSSPQVQSVVIASTQAGQSAKETCQRISPYMTDLMETAKKGPTAGEEIIASFTRVKAELAIAGESATDTSIKTGLSALSASIGEYLVLVEQLKTSPNQVPSNLQEVLTGLGTNGSKVGQLCKQAVTGS
ncbi:hypothetical protein [Arthrobacter sp. GMC3]|uniref:hypothetical protein n=1 Tax=Arthrobacter sp. GMC3 TaxID=2058894 RepID=UPI0011B04B64|nr:hypothetical protein [Arthrobacter sp. GMC3]